MSIQPWERYLPLFFGAFLIGTGSPLTWPSSSLASDFLFAATEMLIKKKKKTKTSRVLGVKLTGSFLRSRLSRRHRRIAKHFQLSNCLVDSSPLALQCFCATSAHGYFLPVNGLAAAASFEMGNHPKEEFGPY